jgi:hypothetical protein
VVTRILLASATAVVLAHLLRQQLVEVRVTSCNAAALVAVVLFLCATAFAARSLRVAVWQQVLAGIGGVAMMLLAAPSVTVPPSAWLVVSLLGGLSLALVAGWIAVGNWWRSQLGGCLVGVGGVLGTLAFLRAGLARSVLDSQTHSLGIAGVVGWAVEMTVLFGVAGLLMFIGGAMGGARGQAAAVR